jgi:hypothetical protein
MNVPVTRITIQAEQKRDALLAARRVRSAIERAGAREVRGEFVLNDGRLYLEVPAATVLPDENELSETAGAAATVKRENIAARSKVDECLNCGNVPEASFAVCPNCKFREISACPSCGKNVPRTQYIAAGGNLFQCPECFTRVRLAYNEPLWRDDGHYNEPVVIVSTAAKRSG